MPIIINININKTKKYILLLLLHNKKKIQNCIIFLKYNHLLSIFFKSKTN